MSVIAMALDPEILTLQRIMSGVVNSSLDIILHFNALPWRDADFKRSVLKQAHEQFQYTEHDGAFSVVGRMGNYMLRPFGWNRRWRNSFAVSIDPMLDCWIFTVMP